MDWNSIIEVALTILLAVVAALVIPWLKERLGSEKLQSIWKMVCIAVQAVKQIFQGSKMGQQKKEYVLQYMEDKGVRVDDAVIEAAVRELT